MLVDWNQIGRKLYKILYTFEKINTTIVNCFYKKRRNREEMFDKIMTAATSIRSGRDNVQKVTFSILEKAKVHSGSGRSF